MHVQAGTRFKPRPCFWMNFQSLSHFLSLLVMTYIAQLIKASDYACTDRYPVQVSVMCLNELSIFVSLSMTYIAQLIKASEYACTDGTRFKPRPCFWMNFQFLSHTHTQPLSPPLAFHFSLFPSFSLSPAFTLPLSLFPTHLISPLSFFLSSYFSKRHIF